MRAKKLKKIQDFSKNDEVFHDNHKKKKAEFPHAMINGASCIPLGRDNGSSIDWEYTGVPKS